MSASHLRRSGSRCCLLALLLALASCGTPAFRASFPTDPRAAAREAAKALDDAASSAPLGRRGMAWLVTGEQPARILAYDLGRARIRWHAVADVASRLVAGPRVVVHAAAEGRAIVGWDADSGARLWERPVIEGAQLGGLAVGEDTVYYVATLGGADGPGTKRGRVDATAPRAQSVLVALAASSGRTRWTKRAAWRLGAPAAIGRRVFVPLGHHSLAVVREEDGAEAARVRSPEGAITWAKASAHGVSFGGPSGAVSRLDAGATKGPSADIAAQLPAIGGVRLEYGANAYRAEFLGYGAHDRNRLLWQVARGEDARHFIDRLIHIHHYRFLLALDSEASGASANSEGPGQRVRWIYRSSRADLVASQHTGRVIMVVSQRGEITALDTATGRILRHHDLQLPIVGATIDAAGVRMAAEGQGRTAAGAQGPALRSSLVGVIRDRNRRVEALKAYCLEQLGALEDPQVPAALLTIMDDDRVELELRERAGELIGARHDRGAIPLYVAELGHRYDYVRDTRAKSVAVLAAAVATLRAPEAIQPLLLHLADHETPLATITTIVAALRQIGDPAVIEPLREYLLTYRCDPEFARGIEALTLIVDTLLELGGSAEQRLLEYITQDAYTLEPLRAHIDVALLTRREREEEDKPAAEKEDVSGEKVERPEGAETEAATRPGPPPEG